MAIIPDHAGTGKKTALTNLAQRLITVAALLPFVLAALLAGGAAFLALALVLALVGVLEFNVMAHGHPTRGSAALGVPAALAVVLAFHFHVDALALAALLAGGAAALAVEGARHPGDGRRALLASGMMLAGLVYVALPAGLLVGLRAAPDGLAWLAFTVCVTWGTDTFAYVGGRLWGRHALAPRISPQKTVEGALTGWIGGGLAGLALLLLANKLTVGLALLALVAPWAAVAGDLLESGVKRHFAVKDSHLPGLNLFPGHGGVLDRVDGLILVAVLNYLAIMVLGVGA